MQTRRFRAHGARKRPLESTVNYRRFFRQKPSPALILTLALGASACVGEISGGSGPAGTGTGPDGTGPDAPPTGMATPSLGGMTPDEVLESDECQLPQPGRAPM